MTESLSGKTRVFFVIGDPIAQVKAPGGVTQELRARGQDAVVVPAQVGAADVERFLQAASLLKNLDGIFATVPHKFAAYRHCATTTERAHFLRSVNLLRRNPDGSWHGDMSDGGGFVAALANAGYDPKGKRALQVGGGGAGSAIAHALLQAGVSELALHDVDTDRLARLIKNLNSPKVRPGSPDPSGFDLIVNATPVGMRPQDPLPVDASKLKPAMFVGDVITAPEVTPLLAAARRLGCATCTGVDMFRAQLGLMVDFMTHK